jgi:hypothetical protein
MIDIAQINKYFEMCRDLHNSYEYLDIHVHPIDIVTGQLNYLPNKNIKGLYSRKESSEYFLPKIEPIHCEAVKPQNNNCAENIRRKIELLMSRKRYDNIGPKVFEDLMTLGGIDKVLFLPVAPCEGNVEEQMRMLMEIYGNNNKFQFAYSVPNDIEDDHIYGTLKNAVSRYGIKAIKIHPNITGINLATKMGIERTEALLSASSRIKLPVIIHGGKSSFLEDKNAREYAVTANLENIDWSLSDSPIVISHAGCYGVDQDEMGSVVLPKIKNMLRRYENILLDTSGIDMQCLTLVLRNVDSDRIVFGSDALYHAQWVGIIYLIESIKRVYRNIEEILLKILSTNASKII